MGKQHFKHLQTSGYLHAVNDHNEGMASKSDRLLENRKRWFGRGLISFLLASANLLTRAITLGRMYACEKSDQKKVTRAQLILPILMAAALFGGCSSDKTGAALQGRSVRLTGPQATLSAEVARVMGFESADDWSLISSTNSIHTEGAVSGEVNGTGWMQITSTPLSTITATGFAIGDAAAIDVFLPEAASWGEVRLILNLPSMGLWWKDLGGIRLEDIAPGAFQEVGFALDAQATFALNGVYSDLEVIVVVNGPTMSGPVLIDNLRFEGEEVPMDTDVDEVPFSFELPDAVALKSVVIQTSESLKLANVVETENATASIINMGTGVAEIGVEAVINGNIYAGGNVILNDRSKVHGFVQAAGIIDERTDVEVDDGSADGVALAVGETYQWNAEWPTVNGVYMNNGGAPLNLSPGAYASVTLNSGDVLNLSAGTYYFDNFMANAASIINVAGNGSPVIVYVRDTFTCRAALNHTRSSADFFVGFAGEGVVDLDGPFAGTVVAPNAGIRLAPLNGGRHEGSFFAKSILAEANTPVVKVPFDHWNDVLPHFESSIPIEPPRILPPPPTAVGCYMGTYDGWVAVDCGEEPVEPPLLTIEEWAIKSKPVDSNDEDSVIPLQFGQVESTLISTKGVRDSLIGRNNFSVQLNTNKFYAETNPYGDDWIEEGEVGVVQGAIMNYGAEGELIIMQVNRSKACGGVDMYEPCQTVSNYMDYYHWETFMVGGPQYIDNRSSGIQDFDFASVAVSTYSDSDGNPVIGMVAQYSWLEFDWRNWLYDQNSTDPYDKANGIFAMVVEDKISLGVGGSFTEVSGDFFGLRTSSEAQFDDTMALTRVLAGSCANTSEPMPEVPWPGVCPEQNTPLINSSVVEEHRITAETNNLIGFGYGDSGPEVLSSVTNDFVYMQYLHSTSGKCDSDANMVYVKDVASDVGVSPSNYGQQRYWDSPDIFVVPEGTPVDENAIASEALLAPGETYDFYIRVHNDFGCEAVTGVKTKIYIANPSLLSASWEDVTGGNYVGGLLNSGITVDPGTSALIGPIHWTAPSNIADGHKCVLASIMSDTQDAPSNEYDAPASHQVAQRNIQFSDCAFPLTNATTKDGYLYLSFTIEGAMPGLGSNTNIIEVTFEDSNGDMYDIWEENEGADYDVTHSSGETTVRLGSRHVVLAPVEFTDGRSIDATGNIVLLQDEPRTHLAMDAKLYEGLDEDDELILQNGASCEKSGTIITE